jgi:hypothetical protein
MQDNPFSDISLPHTSVSVEINRQRCENQIAINDEVGMDDRIMLFYLPLQIDYDPKFINIANIGKLRPDDR